MDGCINDREPARTSDFIKSHYPEASDRTPPLEPYPLRKLRIASLTSLMLTTASFTPRLLTRLSKNRYISVLPITIKKRSVIAPMTSGG